MSVLSGDQTGRPKFVSVWVSMSTWWPESVGVAVTKRFDPSRPTRKAIERPSGDHAGNETLPPGGSSTRSDPSIATSTIDPVPSGRVSANASREPSGLHDGVVSLRPG